MNETQKVAEGGSQIDVAGTEGAARVATRPVQFPLADETVATTSQLPLDRFYDMTVLVSAELGRVELPINALLKLGEGAVIELERTVDEPVEVLAQGMPLARGEVVTVNGRYAVRITQIVSTRPVRDA